MAMPDYKNYDDNNIFAMILRGDIPNKTVYEDDHALAFHDINPQAPIHVLVIPKGKYISMADFTANASADEIAGFWRAVGKTTEALGVVEPGYRLLANHGPHSHQEVPHLHVHILAGKFVGPMLMRDWEGKIDMPNMD
jgi:diadenosine tetraphosphate (Ap4A) HIT family hydrolase